MAVIPKQKHSHIPLIGLGTWKLFGDECEKVVRMALELGYRHIDTADIYKNHANIAKAINPWPRHELFLVTKLFIHDLKPEQVEASVPRFLKELGTDYIDLLLIHWPNPEINPADTLEAMLKFKEEGVVKSIGVSNFVTAHLEELAPYHFPLVANQIELHPYFQRKRLVESCKRYHVPITAYRPLAKGAFEEDPTLRQIGEKYGKTPSQIALRWLVQQDIVVIPKASHLGHLKDNLNIFDFQLTQVDMDVIRQLNKDQQFCAPEGFPIYKD